MSFKPLIKTIFVSLFIILLTGPLTYGQQADSLLLQLDQLTWKDIRNNNTLPVGTRVISGSRSEKSIEELPFTIYVISGEEIRQNGYLTLTDILKRLPGIRVSQPGSALEGETFLMRGLIGNTYAKILVNDVPIKPFVVSGMPIGAQLPIRNAERIEVIYGPAATLYGADASAGVINIILKDSDRPVYAQADLGFGGDTYQNLDVMFGGKLGKGKRVIKFKVFGNYSSFSDRRNKYNLTELYDPKIYENILPTTAGHSYLDRPNYRGNQIDSFPIIGDLPHLSNALGIELNYKRWQFSIQQYYRRDHSSLGLSTYAMSYANPLNYFGERIINGQLKYGFTKNRFRFSTSLNVLTYSSDLRSSYSYVTPFVNFIHQELAYGFAPPMIVDSLSKRIDQLYFSSVRFSSASSVEATVEVLMGYQINKYFELAGGLNIQGGIGDPIKHFSRSPFFVDLTTANAGIVDIDIVNYADISSFLEMYVNYNRWNAILGAQTFKRQNDYNISSLFILNPRVAIQYQLSKHLSLRFSAGRSLRYPSPYYNATSYHIDVANLGNLETGAILSPEKTSSADFGLRWNAGPKIGGDISAYYSKTKDFIRYGLAGADLSAVTLGYSNDESSFAQVYGIQSSLKILDIIPSIGLNTTLNINYTNGQEKSNNINFIGEEIISLDLNDVRAQPRLIAQLDVEMKPAKHIRLLFENTLLTKSLTRNTLLYQAPDQLGEGVRTSNPGYYTLDALVSYQFNKNLVGYFKITNFFNKKYAGIDATEDGDALLYNPQSQSFFRFGVNYRLE